MILIEKECSIYSELNERLRKAVLHSDVKNGCQFKGKLPADYEFNGKMFCILHLPYKEKKLRNIIYKAEEEFNKLVNDKFTTFDYIEAESLNLSIGINGTLSFTGAFIFTLKIHDSTIKSIDITGAEFRGIFQITNSNIEYMYITDSTIYSDTKFTKCQINNFINKRTEFKTTFLQRNDYCLQFPDSNINNFVMIECKCWLYLKFNKTTINSLDIKNNIFYQCPSFYETHFYDKNIEISLPLKSSFKLNEIANINKESWFKRLFRIFVRNKMLNRAMDMEYQKYREIYFIAKKRGFTLEQGEYYFMIRSCLEYTNSEGFCNRFLSRTYRWFSDYGTSITKPLLFLMLVWGTCGLHYKFILRNNPIYPYPLLTSIRQLIKPYDLLFKPSLPFTAYCISFFESTLAIVLLSLILIALRWRFRKD